MTSRVREATTATMIATPAAPPTEPMDSPRAIREAVASEPKAKKRRRRVVIEPADDAPLSETVRALGDLARGKCGGLPVEFVVDAVMAATEGADWRVRRECLAAMLRRIEILKAEGLRAVKRPVGGLGIYRTRGKGAPTKDYETRLDSIAPLRGSCDCRDFVRASLGICKHLFAAILDLFGRERALLRAMDVDGSPRGWTWNPIRPLAGRAGALERIRYFASSPETSPPAAWRSKLRSLGNGVFAPNLDYDDPNARWEFVTALLATARTTPLEPGLRALLEDERARASRLRLLESRWPALSKALKSLRRSLFPYQREGVEKILRRGWQLLADDMGLGKTTQAIAACHALFEAGVVKRGLIVTPNALKAQWEREWSETTSAPVRVVAGLTRDRRAIYRAVREFGGFAIVNYEVIARDLDVLLEFDADIVVLDEAQRVKNWAAQTTANVRRLRPEYRLVLTGTPMENRIDELATILEWIDDRALEPRWRLVPYHARVADGRKDVVGVKNLDTLRERLAPCLVRRRRDEVLKQLPARLDHEVPIELLDEQMERHIEFDQPIAQLVAIAATRPLTPPEHLKLMMLLTKQRMISNGLALIDFPSVWPRIEQDAPSERGVASLQSPKLLELRERVAQLVVAQERKVVIFSQWRRMLQLAEWSIRDVLEPAGLRAVFFSGQEKAKRRQQNIVEFHDDPDCRVFFATDAGGVGLNLQRAANAVINLELPWNPAVLEQRIGRIHRFGQTKPIDVINFVATEGIEARIRSVVGDKRAMFGAIFDGTSDDVRFEKSGRFLESILAATPPKKPTARRETAAATPADEDDAVIDTPVAAAGDAVGDALDGPAAPRDNAAPRVDVAPHAAAVTQAATPRSGTDAPRLPSVADVRRLLEQVEVKEDADGRISVRAPREAFEPLAALLEGVSKWVRRA